MVDHLRSSLVPDLPFSFPFGGYVEAGTVEGCQKGVSAELLESITNGTKTYYDGKGHPGDVLQRPCG